MEEEAEGWEETTRRNLNRTVAPDFYAVLCMTTARLVIEQNGLSSLLEKGKGNGGTARPGGRGNPAGPGPPGKMQL